MTQVDGMLVRQASVADIDLLAPLFDAYRIFYGQSSDVLKARIFLCDRFEHHESVIFIAIEENGVAAGFTQLYPSFSSVSAGRSFILNDLFVVPEARRLKVGSKLLDAAAGYGRAVGAISLSLTTGTGNGTAQALYAALGWDRDTSFYTYNLSL